MTSKHQIVAPGSSITVTSGKTRASKAPPSGAAPAAVRPLVEVSRIPERLDWWIPTSFLSKLLPMEPGTSTLAPLPTHTSGAFAAVVSKLGDELMAALVADDAIGVERFEVPGGPAWLPERIDYMTQTERWETLRALCVGAADFASLAAPALVVALLADPPEEPEPEELEPEPEPEQAEEEEAEPEPEPEPEEPEEPCEEAGGGSGGDSPPESDPDPEADGDQAGESGQTDDASDDAEEGDSGGNASGGVDAEAEAEVEADAEAVEDEDVEIEVEIGDGADAGTEGGAPHEPDGEPGDESDDDASGDEPDGDTGESANGDGEGENEDDGSGDGEGEGESDDDSEDGDGAPKPEPKQLDQKAKDRIDQALMKGAQKIGHVKTLLDDLSPGLASNAGMSKDPEGKPDKRRLKLAEQLERSPSLQRILDLAGRVAADAWKPRVAPSEFARDDLTDIERGADIARAVQSRLVGLRHPLLRRLVFKDIVERTLIQYHLTGHEPVDPGPLIVLLDSSGSMEWEVGDGLKRMALAAAVAIGCIRIARAQKRPLRLAGFRESTIWTWEMKATDPPAKVAEQALALVALQGRGSTIIDSTLRWALSHARVEHSDIVIVTDGEIEHCSVAAEIADARKKLGLRVYSLLIGTSGGDEIRSISDEIYPIEARGKLEAFGSSLSTRKLD